MSISDTLVVVAKKPEPGQTKTRLCPPLTHTQAAALYDCFLRDTLDIMRKVPDVQRKIGFLPDDASDYFQELAPDMERVFQYGESLGERLDFLLTHMLTNGSKKVVVMDSDSPTLPADYVVHAFDWLDSTDVILGPTVDGGYYLIGLKQPQPQLFCKVQMSTPHVLMDTLKVAEELHLGVSLLPEWYDVDTFADLEQLEREVASMDITSNAISTRRWLTSVNWR